MTYNEQGKRTSVENLAGQVTTTAWDGWSVTYNGENRPVLWQCVSTNSPTPNSSTPTLLSMSYDRMGRRVTKNEQRFVYGGYLQIADNNGNAYVWDPTETIATRPLVWNCGASAAYYACDGNKNVSDVIASNGYVSAHYEYAPFGAVIAKRDASTVANPWRFSSEYAEDDTATVYYNYRHYEPVMGRWLQRDPIAEGGSLGLYLFVGCNPIMIVDVLGQVKFNSRYCCADFRSKCREQIEDVRNTLKEYLEQIRNNPEEAFEQASEVIHARPKNAPVKNNPPDPYVDWPQDFRNDYVGRIQKLYDQLKEGEGLEVLCQCNQLDVDTLGESKELCKRKDAGGVTNAGYVRESLAMGLVGRILICRAGMANDAASSGGCGCLVLHELLHYLGFNSKISGAPRKSSDMGIDRAIRVRDMENAMIRLARHLLNKNKKLKCGGYDYGVDVESDDVQIYGPPGKNPPAGRYLW